MKKIKLTPQTYIDMNKEFEENGDALRINIPTQEEIDKWQSGPKPDFKKPPTVDLVAQLWEEHNKKQKELES